MTLSKTVNLSEIIKCNSKATCFKLQVKCIIRQRVMFSRAPAFVLCPVHPYSAGAFSFLMKPSAFVFYCVSLWLHKMSPGPDGVLPLGFNFIEFVFT